MTSTTQEFFNIFMNDEADANIINANGDYSGAVKRFEYQNTDTGKGIVLIKKIIIFVEDAKNFRVDRYGGGLSLALTNGIHVKKVLLDGSEHNVTDSRCPIKTTGDWAKYVDNIHIYDGGITFDYMVASWSFGADVPNIILKPTEKLVVEFNDDFSNLEAHTLQLQGIK